jgi:hypothetical protein
VNDNPPFRPVKEKIEKKEDSKKKPRKTRITRKKAAEAAWRLAPARRFILSPWRPDLSFRARFMIRPQNEESDFGRFVAIER